MVVVVVVWSWVVERGGEGRGGEEGRVIFSPSIL